jgi:hypothetical protein
MLINMLSAIISLTVRTWKSQLGTNIYNIYTFRYLKLEIIFIEEFQYTNQHNNNLILSHQILELYVGFKNLSIKYMLINKIFLKTLNLIFAIF